MIWVEPDAYDNTGVVTLTQTHMSGDAFTIGTTVVTFTAVDAAGNVNTEAFTVTINGEFRVLEIIIYL